MYYGMGSRKGSTPPAPLKGGAIGEAIWNEEHTEMRVNGQLVWRSTLSATEVASIRSLFGARSDRQ